MKLLQINTTACDGSDVFWPWFLWLLAAFLLGLLLGWLIKQLTTRQKTIVADTINTSKQDLTKIEGIGPKIEKLLNKKGINSYAQLANCSRAFLEDMLIEGGPAFTIHRDRTNTWAAQAKLAEMNEWDKLDKWQELLKAGL